MRNNETGLPFHYDPWNPDALQAQETAKEWRGGHWRSPLFCYCSTGCALASEEHRKALLQEIECNMKVVECAAEYFHEDELDKLRNLMKYVQTARIADRRESGKAIDGDEGRRRLDIELIY